MYFDTKYRADAAMVDDFENVDKWSVQGASYIGVCADKINKIEGSQGIKWSANSSGTVADSAVTLNASNACLQIWFFVDNVSNLQGIGFCFRGNPLSEYFENRVISAPYEHVETGWNEWTLNPASFTAQGGALPSQWATITVIRISVKALTGQTVNVTFDDLQMITHPYSKGIVTIGFDDGLASVYSNAKELFDAKGYKAYAAVIIDKVDSPGYMTTSQLRELQTSGWDIISHTKTHSALTSLNSTQLETELGESHEWLVNHGFILGSRFIVYPGNGWNGTVLTYAQDYYLGGGRRVGMQENLPPTTDLSFFAFGAQNTTTLATIQDYIDKARTYSSWLNLYFHDIVEPANSTYDNTPDFLESVLDYIESSGLEVKTLSEVFDDLIGVSSPNPQLYHTTGDLTVFSYKSNILSVKISAPSGTTSVTKVYVGEKGEPVVTGAESWSYNATTHIVTLNVFHRGEETVTLDWQLTATITTKKSTILAGDTVAFNISIQRSNGFALTHYEVNVTRDGVLLKRNLMDTRFTDTELFPQNHTYNITSLFDLDTRTSAAFSCSPLTVSWQAAQSMNSLNSTAFVAQSIAKTLLASALATLTILVSELIPAFIISLLIAGVICGLFLWLLQMKLLKANSKPLSRRTSKIKRAIKLS